MQSFSRKAAADQVATKEESHISDHGRGQGRKKMRRDQTRSEDTEMHCTKKEQYLRSPTHDTI